MSATLAETPVTPTRFAVPYLPEQAYRFDYPNGYTVVFVPKPGEVFNVSTWVKTGSIHEDDRINGISHFLEHLMFKGTTRCKPGEFDRAMESMGAIINAATWKDFTFYYVTGPNDPAGENFATVLDLHADMMLQSTLPEDEIGPQFDPADENYDGPKRERCVVIEEINMYKDQPWTKVYNTINNMMYPEGHPYRRDVIGTREIVATVPRETLEGYYKQWYAPATMTTIVVGDFDVATLEPQVRKAFAFAADAKASAPMTQKLSVSTSGGRYKVITGDYQTAFFIVGYHGPDGDDLKSTLALDVASYVLGESRSSRLVQSLVEKPETPVFNFVTCGQQTFQLGNVFYIQGNFIAPTPDEPLAQLNAELTTFLDTDPITQDEFMRAMKKLKVAFATGAETAAGIADDIGETLTVIGDITHYSGYLQALESLTLQDVRDAAKQFLSLDKAYTTVLVNGPTTDTP